MTCLQKLFGFVLLTIFNLSNGASLNSNETQAKIFAQRSSETFFKVLDQIENAIMQKDEDFDYLEMVEKLRNISKDTFDGSNKFDLENFNDKEIKFAFEAIRDFVVEVVIDEDRFYETMFAFIDLELLPKSESIAKYDDRSVELKYDPDVKNIIKSSNDSDELQYYWTEWRKLTGNWSQHMDVLLQAERDAAELRGMSPLKYWLQHYYIVEMDQLMADITPLYTELHAFIRNRLQKKYGDALVKTHGLIPHHLYEQVLEQAWTNQSIIEDILPHSSLPPLDVVLKKRFMSINLFEIAEGFYEKLGFEKYPYSIWNDRIKPNDKSDDDDCKVNVFYSTPNVHLEYCNNMNFMDFFEAYSQMGKLYYAKEMKDLPAYFFEPYDLEQAVGKAAILSASTHHNLKAVGMIVKFNLTEDVENNRLFRMALQKILQLPLDFVSIKVMTDLLSGVVELKDLNTHYWLLMEKCAGIGPPLNHTSDTLDLPYSFLQVNEVLSTFNMEILSYKIYKKLCELSGKYSEGSLHLCDVHGTKKGGEALRKMMKLGKSKHFLEVLGSSLFPENPNISAESLLEYYEPIRNLTAELNRKANVKTGWK